MNISVRNRELVAELVSTGRYASEQEVVDAGLELVREQEQRARELDERIRRGLADAEAGRMHDLDEVFDELEAELSAMTDIPD